VYNPHIADATAMHREQMLFDIAQRRYGFHAEAEHVVDGLAAIMHKDALRVLHGIMGVRPRWEPRLVSAERIYAWQEPRARSVESMIGEIRTTGATESHLGDLMCDRRLRPAHMLVLLGARFEFRHVVRVALQNFRCNPLCDSPQSINESTAAIAAWRRDACDVLVAVTAVVGSTLARVVVEYLWKRHEPAPLIIFEFARPIS
jgi:hypothetical protein